ncbi:NHL repeat-containing protein [Cyclonatronum proteinivorum]|nr:hypothetical protein [Cyclonatronum proteinivorum]
MMRSIALSVILPVLMLVFMGCASATPNTDQLASLTNGESQGVEESHHPAYQGQPWDVLAEGLRGAYAMDMVPGQNRIFIIEQGRHRLLVLDLQGRRVDSLGVRGRSNYRFDRPSAIDATNGLQLYIADRNNARIQLFDRRLSYLSTITPDSDRAGSNDFFRPGAVAVTAFGDVFAADSDAGALLRFDQNGRLQQRTDLRDTELMLPLRDLLVHDESLFVLESGRGLVHELGSQGSWRRFISGTEGSRAMAADQGGLWVANETELVRFSWQGRELLRAPHLLEEAPVALGIHENMLYLLTASKLFRINSAGWTSDGL